jgi:hypothetical protein
MWFALNEVYSRVKLQLDVLEAEMKQETRAFMAVDAEVNRINLLQHHEAVACLDVGGRKYTTSMETLTRLPDSFLGVLFSTQRTLLRCFSPLLTVSLLTFRCLQIADSTFLVDQKTMGSLSWTVTRTCLSTS